MKEIWKIILNYPNYLVSNLGRVKNNRRGNILKGQLNMDGYRFVKVSDGVTKTKAVHRLVAEHFVKGRRPNTEVNHIDFNRLNNKASNLEWIEHRLNVQKSAAEGRYKTPNKVGERHGRAVLNDIKVLTILSFPKRARNGRGIGFSNKEIAKIYGVSEMRICNIRNGKEWKHLQG